MTMRTVQAIALLVLLTASACVDARAGSDSDDAVLRARGTGFRGILLTEPLAEVDFTLPDTDNRAFQFREEAEGHLTLLFFGYTNCPDICPVHMANLAAVLSRFPHEQRSRVKVVFVTTDPSRDSPEVLRAWLDHFDPHFIGLTGDLDEVNRVQQSLGLPLAVRAPSNDREGRYLVGHAAQVLAFSPDGVGRVAYPFGTRQEDWMHDLPKLLKHEWSEQ